MTPIHAEPDSETDVLIVGGSYEESFVLADVRLGGPAASDEVILYANDAAFSLLKLNLGGFPQGSLTTGDA
jgi:hypothetical protein